MAQQFTQEQIEKLKSLGIEVKPEDTITNENQLADLANSSTHRNTKFTSTTSTKN